MSDFTSESGYDAPSRITEEEINFDEDLTIDDFKKKIIEYGKKSEFPDISE